MKNKNVYSACKSILSQKPLCVMFVLAAALTLNASFAFGQKIGHTTWIKGPTYGASANYDESADSGWIPFQLRPGWIVVDYEDHRNSKFGRAEVHVAYTQAGGNFSSTTSTAAAFDTVIKAAAQKGMMQYAGQLRSQKQRAIQVINQMSSSHRTVSVRATATGAGNFFDQKGSSISGYLKLKVMYIGTPQTIRQQMQSALNQINQQGGNNTGSNNQWSGLTGNYVSNWGRVWIQQNGSQVSGKVMHQNGAQGTFTGQISGRTLTLKWRTGSDFGTAELKINPNGYQLAGDWRSAKTGQLAAWTMTKQR